MEKTVYVTTNGCPENRIDCARIENYLRLNGWSISQISEKADLIIFNACGLTKFNEEKSIRIIKNIKLKKKKNSKFIVCGCLPRINKKRINEIYNGDVFGGASLHCLTDKLHTKSGYSDVHANYLIQRTEQPLALWSKFRYLKNNGLSSITERFLKTKYRQMWDTINIVQPNTYYIKVSSGCDNACSYCAVKVSRKNTKSKSIKKIKKEFIEGLNSGYNQFAFIGTDLGSYGKDIQTDLLTLLNEIISVDGKFEIKLRNVHPQLIIKRLPKFWDILKAGKISHLTTAIQHGSNRILRLMNRHYDIEECKYAFNFLKNNFPYLKIRSQLMVGFPGETEDDFNETEKLVDKIKLDFIEVYKFSRRPNTPAMDMPNQVPAEISMKRKCRLMKKVLKNMETNKISGYTKLGNIRAVCVHH